MGASFDLSALARVIGRVRNKPKQAEQAVVRARGTLMRRLPVQARRDIQAEYALRAQRIAAGLSIRQSGDAVELIGSKRGIGLIEADGRWAGVKSAGASARVRVDEPRHVYDGTFIAAGRGGNRQIFERALVGGRRAARLPIAARYAPSVAQMLRRPGRADRLADFARNVLAAEVARLSRV